jgi:cullin-associated NEDD8-dissociated protein 1
VTASDIDQEVREEAITCMGFLLSMFPSQLPGRSEKALQALFDRSQSEVTRIPAVKTLAKIALSGQVDMSCINSKLARELTSYLKKTNHTLKVSALAALSTIVEKKQLKSNEVDCVVENASKLINDSDAPLASTAIHMLSNIMGVHPESLPSIEAHAMPSVLAYIRSPLVQGGLVEPLQAFFSTLTKTEGATPKKTEKMLALVEQLGLGEKVKQNVRKTAAKCVASICKASGGGKSVDYAKKAITSIAKGGAADDFVVLSLLCIAEIGRGEDLSGCKKIDSTILKCFEANSEDIRGTASYALGSVSVQNLNFFLPKILSHMESHLKLRYLLLLSLKEIVTSVRGDCSECSLTEDNLLGMQEALFCYCETDEEAIRIMCAECLGYMALLKTSVIIPLLVQHLESEKPNVREVAVSAFRDALNDEQAATEGKGDVFEPAIPKFLQKMRDPDVKVKRPAILLLNVLLHNHLDAVRPLMGEALPMLYEATDFKKESLREIELGPFTQIVDDSLQVRRAAYECLLTTVNRSFDTVRPGADAFMDLIINGASDHYDISKISHLSLADHYSLKMTCYGILARLGEVYPPGCVAKASLILPPLYKTLIYSLKSDAVKQEKERLEEVQSACMKCIAKISHVPGMKETEMFGKLMISFNKKPDLLKMFNSF